MDNCKQLLCVEKLVELGGELQRVRWTALEIGANAMAKDIEHAINAVAWSAGIYSPDNNVVDPPNVVDQPNKVNKSHFTHLYKL